MALTWTINKRYKVGKYTRVEGTVAFDTSYPTGGEDFSAGLDPVLSLDVKPSAGYVFSTDYTNKKILAYYADYSTTVDAALIQVADTADVGTAVTAANFEATLLR